MTGLTLAGRAGTPAGFGGLDVIEELGRGAHAVVYRVRRGESEYALKTLRTDIARSAGAAEAVRREAGLLACVSAPSSLAISTAQALGLQLWAFVREGRATRYA